MTSSSTTQNLQPADHSTLVLTGAGGRLKHTIQQSTQIDEGPENESCSVTHCEYSHRVSFLVKCAGVGCSLQVNMLLCVTRKVGSLLTSTLSLCSSISPVFLRGQLKARYGSVMTNAVGTAVSVARSVVS
jgi:hypothetical protein